MFGLHVFLAVCSAAPACAVYILVVGAHHIALPLHTTMFMCFDATSSPPLISLVQPRAVCVMQRVTGFPARHRHSHPHKHKVLADKHKAPTGAHGCSLLVAGYMGAHAMHGEGCRSTLACFSCPGWFKQVYLGTRKPWFWYKNHSTLYRITKEVYWEFKDHESICSAQIIQIELKSFEKCAVLQKAQGA